MKYFLIQKLLHFLIYFKCIKGYDINVLINLLKRSKFLMKNYFFLKTVIFRIPIKYIS